MKNFRVYNAFLEINSLTFISEKALFSLTFMSENDIIFPDFHNRKDYFP